MALTETQGKTHGIMAKDNDDNKQVSIEQIVKDYRPRIGSFIRSRMGNSEDAEDVLQEVFYQLVRAFNDDSNPIVNISAWMFRVARNMMINMGRKRHEESLSVFTCCDNEMALQEIADLLMGGDDTTPETEYMRSLVWEELEIALSELPPEQREVFVLTELDGIPVKEIAKTTGIPQSTLLSRKHYAVKYLRRRMRIFLNLE